jgi:hypothetical protein
MSDCGATCPDLSVPCDSRPHGRGVAHHASGTADDGTRWSLFWWLPGEAGEAGEAGEVGEPPAVGFVAPGSPPWTPGSPRA